MQYVSTRGRAPTLGFSDVLLAGLATDGGLYLPALYPAITSAELTRWRGLAYADLAAEVIAKFVDDIPQETLLELCRRTYTPSVYGNGRPDSDTALITPLRWLEPGLGLLELSNGPTLAFKDMAMQLLGALFEYVLERRGERLNVLGATSGDTGSAAEYAMRGRRGIEVFMLSPQGRMSAFQRAQMYSLQDANIHNLAVKGVFDDCQDLVKAVAGDLPFSGAAPHRHGELDQLGPRGGAGRVLRPRLPARARARTTRRVSFAVPSGNFGNVFSGWVGEADGAADRPAGARDERERRARRVLPHRALPRCAAAARPTRPAARRWTSRRRRTSSATSST